MTQATPNAQQTETKLTRAQLRKIVIIRNKLRHQSQLQDDELLITCHHNIRRGTWVEVAMQQRGDFLGEVLVARIDPTGRTEEFVHWSESKL